MMEIAVLKFLHVLGLVYWLGTDLGVFYSSFIAVDRKLSAETRVTAIRMLFALDMAPRLCMPLMLPVGAHLAWRLGYLPLTDWGMILTWFFALLWLGMVVYIHFGKKGTGFQQFLTRFDFGFRLGVIAILATYAAVSLTSTGGTRADFVAWKILIFAVMIGCGLMVRIKLKPFGPAYANLVKGKASQQDEDAIEGSIASTRPWVMVIWLGLLLSAALGLHVI